MPVRKAVEESVMNVNISAGMSLHCVAGPNFSDILASVGVLEEDPRAVAIVVWSISIGGVVLKRISGLARMNGSGKGQRTGFGMYMALSTMGI